LGIGLSSNIDRKLHVEVDNTYAAKFGGTAGGDFAIEIGQTGTNQSAGFNSTNETMKFSTEGSEKMRLDSGNLLVGTTSESGGLQNKLTSHSVGKGQFSVIDTTAFSTANVGGALNLGGNYRSTGDAQAFCRIEAVKENTTNNNYSYALQFSTTKTGNANFSTVAMRIDSDGNLLVGTTNTDPTNSNVVGIAIKSNGQINHSSETDAIVANRKGSDGNIVLLRQDGTTEGTISVSGTTVSYNGGHLARWSRLLDNSKDTSIVKGTVMTNLDEMVEWDDEDNEQLNKMAVSTVEGDANVAGVFVNWDNDDDWNDMNIAMTGDMVIRIAQGTTVARGDLLMSAGDGTAKPQGDEIVRSKTIAKVTSTNVSHTYDDGTYLVPCVLMAC